MNFTAPGLRGSGAMPASRGKKQLELRLPGRLAPPSPRFADRVDPGRPSDTASPSTRVSRILRKFPLPRWCVSP